MLGAQQTIAIPDLQASTTTNTEVTVGIALYARLDARTSG